MRALQLPVRSSSGIGPYGRAGECCSYGSGWVAYSHRLSEGAAGALFRWLLCVSKAGGQHAAWKPESSARHETEFVVIYLLLEE
jgi:hypothetical protein